MKLFAQDASTTKEATQFRTAFERETFEHGLVNKFDRTYKLYITAIKNYGFKAKLYCSPGLSYKKLQEKLPDIEQNLNSIILMKVKRLQGYADMTIVTKPVDVEIPYQNPKIKPHEMWLGMSLEEEPIINDCNANCMFLIAGATGSGKTRFISGMLLSWILSCSPNQVELYLADVAKDEYVNFRYVKHVKYYASELEELLLMLMYLRMKMEKRKKVISEVRDAGKATNIEEYNKLNPKCPMSYCYILIDEASILMPSAGESNEVKQTKQAIMALLSIFSKTCRSYGIFPVVATQKTVKEEIPAILKDMATVRIAFRVNNGKSSESILGDDSAVGLEDRYAMYSQDGGCNKDLMFTPKLTTQYLNELMKPHIDRSRKKINLVAELAAYEERQKITPGTIRPAADQKGDKKKGKKEPAKGTVIPMKLDDPADNPYDNDFIKVSGGDYNDY